MAKELAQTVSGKRIAFLIAILAAFAVFAVMGNNHRSADASDEGSAIMSVGSAVHQAVIAVNSDIAPPGSPRDINSSTFVDAPSVPAVTSQVAASQFWLGPVVLSTDAVLTTIDSFATNLDSVRGLPDTFAATVPDMNASATIPSPGNDGYNALTDTGQGTSQAVLDVGANDLSTTASIAKIGVGSDSAFVVVEPFDLLRAPAMSMTSMTVGDDNSAFTDTGQGTTLTAAVDFAGALSTNQVTTGMTGSDASPLPAVSFTDVNVSDTGPNGLVSGFYFSTATTPLNSTTTGVTTNDGFHSAVSSGATSPWYAVTRVDHGLKLTMTAMVAFLLAATMLGLKVFRSVRSSTGATTASDDDGLRRMFSAIQASVPTGATDHIGRRFHDAAITTA